MLRTKTPFKASLMLAALSAPLLFAAPADAADEGFYLGAGAGWNWHRDSDIEGTGINTTADFDTGLAAGAALGYYFGNGFRGELDVTHRKNDVDSLTGAATAVSGEVKSWAAMINALYDIDTGTAFTPYLGAGLGMMHVNADGATPVGGSIVNDSDWVPVAQISGGVAYALSEAMDLFADYRYLHGLADAKLYTANQTQVDAEIANHTFMIGLRWNFGAPAAAPAPEPISAAAPAQPDPAPVPREFIVFFDWDQSVLTNEAATIVDSAAGYAKAGKIVRIELTGHADRSGTDNYNMGLSKRRAEAVQRALVAQGIAADEIGLTWKGETEPLVQTADGVREPQNRRVHIVFP